MKATVNIFTTNSTRTMTAFAALVLILCASCTKGERQYDDPQQEIAFRPIDRQITKADMAEGTIFGLFAYHSDLPGGTEWGTAWETYPDLYIDNASFAKIGNYYAGVSSETHHPYYWPITGSLMFAGYSPYAEVDEDGTSSGEGPVTKVTLHRNVIPGASNPYLEIGYEMPEDNSSAAMEGKELLYFDVSSVMNGKTAEKQNTPLTVDFKRALSLLELNVTHEYTSVSITLTECINKGVFYSGKAAGWMPDSSVDAAGKLTSIKNYDFAVDSESEFSVSKYIIPQYTDGWFEEINSHVGSDIMLELTIKDQYATGTAISTETIEIPLKNYIPRFEMGKKYILNMTISKDPIEFGTPEITINETTVTL